MSTRDIDCAQVAADRSSPSLAPGEVECKPRHASPHISLRVIRDFGEWLKLRDVWDELLRHSVYPNVFASWEWQTIWWKWFGASRTLNILLVEDGQRTLGIAPLYIDKNSRISLFRHPMLRFIGNGGAVFPEYLGLIARCEFVEDVCATIANHLSHENSEWDTFKIEEFALDDPGTKRLAEQLGEDVACIVRETESRIFISLPASYDEYLVSLGAHNRNRKRDRLRQAISRHNATLVTLNSNNIESWFQIIADLSNKSRVRQGGMPSFSNINYAGFHRDLLSTIMPLGHAKVLLLMLDDKPAAFLYLLSYNSKFYAYQTGIDVSRPGSPGDVALQMAIMHAIEAGGSEFDFLRGAHSYKQAYGKSMRTTQSVTAFRRQGWSYARQMFIERVLRPTKRSLCTIAGSLHD